MLAGALTAQGLLAINSLYNPERRGVCVRVQHLFQHGSTAVHPARELVCTQGFEIVCTRLVLKVRCLWLPVEGARLCCRSSCGRMLRTMGGGGEGQCY